MQFAKPLSGNGKGCAPVTNDDLLAFGLMPEDVNAANGPLMVIPGSMGGHHARILHGSPPKPSDRARMILFYECARADAWPIPGSNSCSHTLGQRKFCDDLQGRLITGQPCLTPRMEQVPVTMPLPPAPDTGSIFKTRDSAGAKSALAKGTDAGAS